MTLHLHGIGHYHPDNEISNAFLESLDIGTDEAWILERVGIRSRRTALPLDYIRETRNADPAAAIEAAELSIAEMGARAARMALARAGIGVEDLGMVVSGCCAPDTVSPAQACNIAGLLGAEVPAFDVSSACTSFYTGVDVLSRMRPDALPSFVLLVCAEGMTRCIDYNDRSTAVLWGDGAVAVVLSASEPGRARIVGTSLASSPAGAGTVVIPRLGYFRQDGRAVQMFGIRMSSEMILGLRDEFEEDGRTLHFVGHQANLRMLEAIARRCGIAPERHHYNVDRFGNTAGASSGTVISERWQDWRAGDDVAVAGVGAGLTWSRYLLRFDG
ncbi:ketoacyl-ACP synthase III [Pseudenhygromyxa sp. WMMC2535]|uniref:ketoacyl-ACP synthase III n=1 Tax=Pseudenhygromyxa sp. WMMC2535 TaxID=2712867 RepID=UPI0015570435|nr:ketoacyl-ACP synthase III [Pseudenhygromyxa sp. WMMC2535]NVB41270.1 ketoacyl-ACP synthase III [Pseudenhygromyxa sp. WMMC2535]